MRKGGQGPALPVTRRCAPWLAAELDFLEDGGAALGVQIGLLDHPAGGQVGAAAIGVLVIPRPGVLIRGPAAVAGDSIVVVVLVVGLVLVLVLALDVGIRRDLST